jgi:hypothetical protein
VIVVAPTAWLKSKGAVAITATTAFDGRRRVAKTMTPANAA